MGKKIRNIRFSPRTLIVTTPPLNHRLQLDFISLSKHPVSSPAGRAPLTHRKPLELDIATHIRLIVVKILALSLTSIINYMCISENCKKIIGLFWLVT